MGGGNSCPSKDFILSSQPWKNASQVLQVVCCMECSLLGEQKQSHSTDTYLVQIMVNSINNFFNQSGFE